MTWRSRLGCGLGVACLLIAPSIGWAQSASDQITVRSVNVSKFPAVSMTVSLGGAESLSPDDVAVTENGTHISDVTIRSLAESGRRVNVVLAIDTSGSMLGAPLASAVRAARDFVSRLPDNVHVGVVTFSSRPAVLARITGDHADVLKTIKSLRAAGETALYDGVAAAAKLLPSAGQHNIVLLSDGGDTVSNLNLATAIGAARKADAAIFAVGLRTEEVDVGALRALSSRTDGRYSPAATADLSTIYEGLATELSSQYVVGYRSAAEGGEQLSVEVTAAGATDSIVALAPKSAVPDEPAAPPRAEVSDPLLSGGTGLVAVLVLSFAAIGLLAFLAMGGVARARREARLARLLAVTETDDRELAPGTPLSWIPDPLIDAAQRVANRGSLGAKIDASLESAGVSLKSGEFLATSVAAAIVGGLLGGLLLANILFALLLAVAAGVVPFVVLDMAKKKRLRRLHGQLPDVLMIVAGALRAGHSFQQGLDMVTKEVGGPAADEFGRVIAEVRLGRPIEDALIALAERVGSQDFEWAVLAINIQREVGGNLAEVLETVAGTIREREEIRRQVDVLSSEGRLSVWILTVLPFLIGIYIAFVNPDYLDLLFSTSLGLLMVFVAGGLLTLGIWWMRKLVRVDV